MDKIGQAIVDFLRENFKDDKNLIFEAPNIVSVISYWSSMMRKKRMRKRINWHRDQRYSTRGEFMREHNCQKEGTVTAILAFGDTRQLNFILCRHKDVSRDCDASGPYRVVQEPLVFNLEHGTLFVLIPDDEKLLMRDFYSKDHHGCPTFFKHGCSGVGYGCMSLGLVFRVSVHSREVAADTGLLKLTAAEKVKESPTFVQSDKMLREYTKSKLMKEREAEAKDLWRAIRFKHFGQQQQN